MHFQGDEAGFEMNKVREASGTMFESTSFPGSFVLPLEGVVKERPWFELVTCLPHFSSTTPSCGKMKDPGTKVVFEFVLET